MSKHGYILDGGDGTLCECEECMGEKKTSEKVREIVKKIYNDGMNHNSSNQNYNSLEKAAQQVKKAVCEEIKKKLPYDRCQYIADEQGAKCGWGSALDWVSEILRQYAEGKEE